MRTSAPDRESRLPVGSSAKMISGRVTNARADRDPLLLAARELGRSVAEPVGQADGAHHLVEPRCLGLAASERERQHDVGARRHGGDQVEGLEDEPDAFPAQDRQRAVVERTEVLPADRHPTTRDRVEPGHAVQQRRLPRPRCAHDRGEPLLGNCQRQSVERTDAGVTGSVHLGHRLGTSGNSCLHCIRHGALLGRGVPPIVKNHAARVVSRQPLRRYDVRRTRCGDARVELPRPRYGRRPWDHTPSSGSGAWMPSSVWSTMTTSSTRRGVNASTDCVIDSVNRKARDRTVGRGVAASNSPEGIATTPGVSDDRRQ